MAESQATKARTVSGLVVSNTADKTIAVRVDRRVRHPLYGKIIGRSSKFQVHDENNEAQIGDTVSIQECRPQSKTKSWKLLTVDERVKKAQT
ncbi:MAG: 30S ribosomal protein S17 [Gammaproteobacteria bacterium]|nr:30S ribosomal protein S17 [Gammaproteobacteria bacterium]MYF01728.1 30S ribosomal protein S17 [Gammaproteobacteria bacterium]MYI76187.1 30S ribosomal protein S17 [Gammaproteobacteria bacterium]